jgi:hypothetical protein
VTTEQVEQLRLNPTMWRVLRHLSRGPNGRQQIAGHGRAPYLSAARGLMRRGLANSWETGVYWISSQGREVLAVVTTEQTRPAATRGGGE